MALNITCKGVSILSSDGNDTPVFELWDVTRYIIGASYSIYYQPQYMRIVFKINHVISAALQFTITLCLFALNRNVICKFHAYNINVHGTYEFQSVEF